jgi:hypothetical protein
LNQERAAFALQKMQVNATKTLARGTRPLVDLNPSLADIRWANEPIPAIGPPSADDSQGRRFGNSK